MFSIPNPVDGWSMNKVLGSGGFGIVELWIHISGNKLAIKKCKWDVAQLTETQQKRWVNEVEIMNRLKHKNIIKALELPFKHPDNKIELPILCMEYCRKGDLRKVLNETENCCGVSEKQAISVIKDISSAVEYLHSNNITHRDLKPENIVLQEERDNVSYKLIDLGYAKELGEASATASLVGTLNYVAPELLWRQKYSCSVDYWSLGILFYELVTGTRPFLPKMQHTMTWMQHIRNKDYDDICAFESDGKIVFGKDIMDPTNLSRCLRNGLVEWFRVALQWDPKKRGKQLNKDGTMELVIFKLLHSILSKKIVYVFSALIYKINVYEIIDTTSVIDLQRMIENDTNIPINQQTLTDYFGKILIANETPLLSQINQDPILFVFKDESILMENIPVQDVPIEIQKMIQLARNQLDYDTLKDYYRVTVFFMKQGVHLFQLYIFALTIKVDLIIGRINTFNDNITNALTNINALLNELSAIRDKWKEEVINKQKIKALDINFDKVVKLDKAAHQIKSKFEPLIEESKQLKSVAESIDCMKNMLQAYNKAIEIFELFKSYHKNAKPTEMVKTVFNFLKAQEEQFRKESLTEIMKQILKLEFELVTLERIFDSVLAMTTVYRDELQNTLECTLKCSPDVLNKKQCLNALTTTRELTSTPVNNDNLEMSVSTSTLTKNDSVENSSGNYCSKMSIDSCTETTEESNSVIYDNLVIRYTLDNLLIEIQKKYMEMVSLEP